MIGLGTIINTVAIIVAGFIGHFAGKIIKPEQQDGVTKACGAAVMFISIAGAMEGMLFVSDGKIVSGKALLVVLCVALGTLIGELISIDDGFNRFAEWLKKVTGNSKDRQFVDAFITATMTVCIGAMAIVGSIEDGLSGDFTTLLVKTILDFIMVMFLTSTMGKGAAFSSISVLLFQGTITLLAKLISPILTELALNYISTVGSVLIFCVGINLVFGKKIKVANMLPAVILSVIAAYLNFF